MDEHVLVTRIAASLNVLIEGIADHKMTAYNQEQLAMQIVTDIRELCA